MIDKIEIFWKFAWKNQIFFTRIHTPQISNQIDTADISSSQPTARELCPL